MRAQYQHRCQSRSAVGLTQFRADTCCIGPRDDRKEDEGDDRGQKSEQENVADVFEELLPLHVEGSRKHDWRQAEVEKQIIAELHQLSELLLSSGLVCV